MRKVIGISAGVLLFAAIAAAETGQQCTDTTAKKMMTPSREFKYVSPGISWNTAGSVNRFLNESGFTGFPDHVWTLSFGREKEFRRLVFDHSLTIRIYGDNLNAGVRTSLYEGDMMGRAGFNVLSPDLFTSLYPYIGFGAGMNALYFRESSKTLGSALATSEPNVYAWQLTPLFDLGLGSNFQFANKDKTRGLVAGLRVGFLTDLYYTKRWHSSGTVLSDLPAVQQTGPYVKLILGGWGPHKGHHHHEM
jgi:hypothetical protein